MMNGARSSTGSEDDVTDLSINLKRGEMGFGFRIVGGQEQKTQVSRFDIKGAMSLYFSI